MMKATKQLLRQFIRFGCMGALGTAAQYLLLFVLMHSPGRVSSVVASTFGMVLGAIVNYWLNRRYTFKSNRKHAETMPRFFSVALAGLALNGMVMIVTVERLHIYYFAGQIIATGCVLVWNFVCNRFWTFKEQGNGTAT